LPQFETVILTQYRNNPRFTEVEELHAIAMKVVRQQGLTTNVICRDAPPSAWQETCHLTPLPTAVVVAGSFFLAAEMMPLIRG
jgi:folylpolyglutamate synthase/dihydropteroate synthase